MVQLKWLLKRCVEIYIAAITVYVVWISWRSKPQPYLKSITPRLLMNSSHIGSRLRTMASTTTASTATKATTTKATIRSSHNLLLKVKELLTHSYYHNAFTIRSLTAKTKYYISRNKTLELSIGSKCAQKFQKISLTDFPVASIIISFYQGEKLDHLLHTLHSIMVNSPRQLVHEIILIADNTKAGSHQLMLENYVNFHFPGVVKILRSRKQLGLIQGRLLGARAASGDVIIIMDSHCEVQPHWLEALLYEIRKNPTTMVTPMLDWMKPGPNGSWTYEFGSNRYKTVFYWNLGFTFMDIPAPDLTGQTDPTEPIQSPATVGTCWAMDKEYFKKIGELDDNMVVWGGENIDLALRAVLFGGRHVNVPCSHVAHLEESGMRDYRGNFDPSVNYMRVAETWFDDYKDVYYIYNPHLKGRDFGDISDRLLLKKKATYNFGYFLKNFYPELGAPGFWTFAWGQLNNLGLMKLNNRDICLTSWWDQPLKMEPCLRTPTDNKILMWDYGGEFRGALMAHVVDPDGRIMAHGKPNFDGLPNRQRWIHWKGGPLIPYHTIVTRTCLEVFNNGGYLALQLAECNLNNSAQRWTFQRYDSSYELLEQGKYQPPPESSEEVKMYFEAYRTTYRALNSA